jgi:hypothetical protein
MKLFIGINVVLSWSQGFQFKPFHNVNRLTKYPYVFNGIFAANGWQDASNNLVKLCEILNLDNKLKSLTMFVCMETNKLSKKFLALVLAMWNTRHIVTCFSDPMHGSTIKAALGLKTQRSDAILVNLTIWTPLFIPWCVDETCLVYWGYPWTNSWILFFPQNVDNQTHTHVHSMK